MKRRKASAEMLREALRHEGTLWVNTPSTDSIISLAIEDRQRLAQGPTPLNLPSKSQNAEGQHSAYVLQYALLVVVVFLPLCLTIVRRSRSGSAAHQTAVTLVKEKQGTNVQLADKRPADDVIVKHEVHDEAAHSQLTEDTVPETRTAMSTTPTEKVSHKRSENSFVCRDAYEARRGHITPIMSNKVNSGGSCSQVGAVPNKSLVAGENRMANKPPNIMDSTPSGGRKGDSRFHGMTVDCLVHHENEQMRLKSHGDEERFPRGGSSICSDDVEGGRRTRSLFSGEQVRLVRSGDQSSEAGEDSSLHISRCRSLSPVASPRHATHSPHQGRRTRSLFSGEQVRLVRSGDQSSEAGKDSSLNISRCRSLSPVVSPRHATRSPHRGKGKARSTSATRQRALSPRSRCTIKSPAKSSVRQRNLSPQSRSQARIPAPSSVRKAALSQEGDRKDGKALYSPGRRIHQPSERKKQSVKAGRLNGPKGLDNRFQRHSAPSKQRSAAPPFESPLRKSGSSRVALEEDDARTLDTTFTLSTLNTLNTNGGFDRIMEEVTQIQSERDMMRAELETAKKALANVSSGESGNLQFELEWAREELERARSRIAHIESERDTLRVDLENAVSDLNNFQSKTNVVKTELEVLHKKNSQLQFSLNDMVAERAKASETQQLLKEKEAECDAFEAREAALASEIERLKKEHEGAVDELKNSYDQEIDGLKFSNRVMRSRLMSLAESSSVDANAMLGYDVDSSSAGENKYNVSDPAVIRALLEDRDEKINDMESRLAAAEKERKNLHNKIQELQGNIRVFVRVRPFVSSIDDLRSNVQICSPINISAPKEKLTIRDQARNEDIPFSFDRVFGSSYGQEGVFDEVSGLVQSAIDGYNVCIFSYGQTGSGKTHTMLGYGGGEMRGIIPRAAEQILEQARGLRLQNWKFHVKASFLEIYNEKLRDLLTTDNLTKLTIRKDEDGKTFVDGLSCVDVDPYDAKKGMDQLSAVMSVAARARSVTVTKMNETSSRSHSVFMLDILGFNADTGTIVNGSLNLCDLAGSERLHRSKVDYMMDAKHLKETQSINKSLSCLGDVFNALAIGSSHVPFRNSRLTYLLQDCFSGDGKALMIVNLSPTMQSSKESLCSLRFAQRVNRIELGRAVKHVKQGKKVS
mmetsp:Transcript_5184/g.14966  ORF Transcript_5184/g.14966 Transcript_5184/m.14966 type:complete len:1150 (-) Transcript_5184:37-3486(-)